jgi:hypothetical protein
MINLSAAHPRAADGTTARTADDPSAPGRPAGGQVEMSMRFRFPRSGRRRRLSATAVALAVAAVTTSWAVAAGPAQAGGVSVATCPSGKLGKVSAAYHDFVATHPEIALTKLARVEAGFYAEAGRYWPPATSITCATKFRPGKPFVKTDGVGCPKGWLPFDIPVSSGAGVTVTWGTFVPKGYYALAGPTDKPTPPGWTTLCRAPVSIAPLT